MLPAMKEMSQELEEKERERVTNGKFQQTLVPSRKLLASFKTALCCGVPVMLSRCLLESAVVFFHVRLSSKHNWRTDLAIASKKFTVINYCYAGSRSLLSISNLLLVGMPFGTVARDSLCAGR